MIAVEAYEGGIAQAGDTNILVESQRNPDPKRKGLLRNRPISPDQSPKCWGQNLLCVVAHRLSGYLQRNHLIDALIQKAGISGFSSCLEHTSTIWHHIQVAKKEGTDLHVVVLDLTNSFNSAPHNLLCIAFDFFRVPVALTSLIKAYYQDIQLCLTLDYTTAWQYLEVGIMASCTISPLPFTMAMEVIIRVFQWVVGGQSLRPGLRLPLVRAYMDNLTTLTTIKACTVRLLNKLQENIELAQMRIKPSKSRSISIVKGKLSDQCFYISDKMIPTVSGKPVKSLGQDGIEGVSLGCWHSLLKPLEVSWASVKHNRPINAFSLWCHDQRWFLIFFSIIFFL